MKMVSLTDIRNSLTPETMRPMQVINLAIMAGATSFLGVIIFMYYTASGEYEFSQENIGVIDRFSVIHGIIFISCLGLSNFVKKKFFSRERAESISNTMVGASDSEIAGAYIGMVRMAKIVYMAILEAPAFFGLVVCFLAITNRVIYEYSFYWANLVSYFTFMFLLARDFPTREKVAELFKTDLKYLLK